MSVAREAAGRSSTSPGSATPGSSGGWAGLVKGWPARRPARRLEEVPAEQVAGVRALHVGPGVHDDVQGPGGRRECGLQVRSGGRVPVAGRTDLVERDGVSAGLAAAAALDV